MSDKLIRRKLKELVEAEATLQKKLFGVCSYKTTNLQTYLARHSIEHFTLEEVQSTLNDVNQFLKEIEEDEQKES